MLTQNTVASNESSCGIEHGRGSKAAWTMRKQVDRPDPMTSELSLPIHSKLSSRSDNNDEIYADSSKPKYKNTKNLNALSQGNAKSKRNTRSENTRVSRNQSQFNAPYYSDGAFEVDETGATVSNLRASIHAQVSSKFDDLFVFNPQPSKSHATPVADSRVVVPTATESKSTDGFKPSGLKATPVGTVIHHDSAQPKELRDCGAAVNELPRSANSSHRLPGISKEMLPNENAALVTDVSAFDIAGDPALYADTDCNDLSATDKEKLQLFNESKSCRLSEASAKLFNLSASCTSSEAIDRKALNEVVEPSGSEASTQAGFGATSYRVDSESYYESKPLVQQLLALSSKLEAEPLASTPPKDDLKKVEKLTVARKKVQLKTAHVVAPQLDASNTSEESLYAVSSPKMTRRMRRAGTLLMLVVGTCAWSVRQAISKFTRALATSRSSYPCFFVLPVKKISRATARFLLIDSKAQERQGAARNAMNISAAFAATALMLFALICFGA